LIKWEPEARLKDGGQVDGVVLAKLQLDRGAAGLTVEGRGLEVGHCCKHGFNQRDQGPMLGFSKYLRRNSWQKYWRFFVQTTASFCKNVIITLGFFRKMPIFSQKTIDPRGQL
jgi:hypothetical protein